MANQPTLSDCRVQFENRLAAEYKTLTVSDETQNEIDSFWQKPIAYDEVHRGSFEIDTLKGRNTKKYLHVIVTRLSHGFYELVMYAN